jgi:hypothetical protein
MAKQRAKADRELQAMSTIIEALDGLEGESIQRVLDYVLGRLSISRPMPRSASLTLTGHAPTVLVEPGGSARQISIRDLKDEKQPDSSNQMAALVAYYLTERAPESERKQDINAADIQRYFKQAGFKLPKSIPNTLPNATAAGYFDQVGGGRYRLNPVGYNLVVHGLPRSSESTQPSRRKKQAKTKKARR